MNIRKLGVIALVAIVAIGFLVLLSIYDSESNGGDNGDDPVPNGNGIPDFEGIEGISVDDDEILLSPEVLVTNHIDAIDGQSMRSSLSTMLESEPQTKEISDGNVLITDPDNNTETYYDGIFTYTDESDSYTVSQEDLSRSDVDHRDIIDAFLTDVDIESAEETDDGVELYLEGGDDFTKLETTLTDFNTVSGANAEVNIRNDGLIESYTLNVIGTGLFVDMEEYTFTVEQLGDVTVDEPAWVDIARSSNIVLDVTIDDNWLQVDHAGLRDIETSHTISVAFGDNEYQTQLETPLSADDRLYLYIRDNELQTSINQEPTDYDGIIIDSAAIAVTDEDDETYYNEIV